MAVAHGRASDWLRRLAITNSVPSRGRIRGFAEPLALLAASASMVASEAARAPTGRVELEASPPATRVARVDHVAERRALRLAQGILALVALAVVAPAVVLQAFSYTYAEAAQSAAILLGCIAGVVGPYLLAPGLAPSTFVRTPLRPRTPVVLEADQLEVGAERFSLREPFGVHLTHDVGLLGDGPCWLTLELTRATEGGRRRESVSLRVAACGDALAALPAWSSRAPIVGARAMVEQIWPRVRAAAQAHDAALPIELTLAPGAAP